MIKADEKTGKVCCYFGYGTIVVIPTKDGLKFVEIKPPQEIGTFDKTKIEKTGHSIVCNNVDGLKMLKFRLEHFDVETETQFIHANCMFKFLPNSHKSIEIIKNAVDKTLELILSEEQKLKAEGA
jgi:hypothetical protein